MTAGQRLIEQGRQQGFELGMQLGVHQGIQSTLLCLLCQRFGDAVNAPVVQRIATASREQLEAWTGRVLSAATLAEALAG
jgi:hypothetical protein